MAWVKGQPWRVVRSLNRLDEQIRQACPRAVPPATPATSWGSIADSAHSTSSDHYPHYYAALGSVAVVCARDFPHAPSLGLDAHAVADALRRSRDPRIGYLISNGRITSPGRDWRWGAYSGSDPHDTHIHVSSVHTARADDPGDWQIGIEGDDMGLATTGNFIDGRTEAQAVKDLWWATFKGNDLAVEQRELAQIKAMLAQLAGKDMTDEGEIVAGVLAGLDPAAIAAAIPPELARQVADELAARMRE